MIRRTNLLRKSDSHKGNYGHVLVVAGSRGMAGAAWLCARGAALAGAGKVTLATPRGVYPLVARRLTEVMTLPLPETPAGSVSYAAHRTLERFLARAQSLALGPGLSIHESTRRLVVRLVRSSAAPFVLDADGLNSLPSAALLRRKRSPAVVTPHDGEFLRLTGIRPPKDAKTRKEIAKKFSIQYDCTLVLKGFRTIVSAPGGKVYVNRTGNPGMAKGGSGDVLTGIIASFLAQGFDPFFASCLAVYAHGKAGDRAARLKGRTSLQAADVAGQLAPVLKKLETVRNLKKQIGF